jgi:hypothetical protein
MHGLMVVTLTVLMMWFPESKDLQAKEAWGWCTPATYEGGQVVSSTVHAASVWRLGHTVGSDTGQSLAKIVAASVLST